MKNRDVVIVGGGQVAYRKLVELLQVGARITIISPMIHEKIESLIRENQIIWKNKLFEAGDLTDALLVIAATNNRKVNEAVRLSAGTNQLVNVVDNHELSLFHIPAKLYRGNLTISVATGGASPILARAIRDQLAEIYDESYHDYLVFLARARELIKQFHFSQDQKKQLLKAITEDSYRRSKRKQKEYLELLTDAINQQYSFELITMKQSEDRRDEYHM